MPSEVTALSTCPRTSGWLAEYLHELTMFPGGKHDDQVDSSAQMLDWFKQAGRGGHLPVL